MKQELNLAKWWRHLSGRTVVESAVFYTMPTKMAPPGGEIWHFFFVQATLSFILYHMQKFLDIFNILGVVRYWSFELTGSFYIIFL